MVELIDREYVLCRRGRGRFPPSGVQPDRELVSAGWTCLQGAQQAQELSALSPAGDELQTDPSHSACEE